MKVLDLQCAQGHARWREPERLYLYWPYTGQILVKYWSNTGTRQPNEKGIEGSRASRSRAQGRVDE